MSILSWGENHFLHRAQAEDAPKLDDDAFAGLDKMKARDQAMAPDPQNPSASHPVAQEVEARVLST